MSFRCGICRGCAPPGAPMARHVVYKPGMPRQIDREVPLCPDCADAMSRGRTVAELVAEFADAPAAITIVPAARPAPAPAARAAALAALPAERLAHPAPRPIW